MRRFRTFFTQLLVVLLIFDGVTAFRLWWYGLRYVWMKDGRMVVETVPFTSADLLFLLLFAGLHGVLIFAVWRAWRSDPSRVQ